MRLESLEPPICASIRRRPGGALRLTVDYPADASVARRVQMLLAELLRPTGDSAKHQKATQVGAADGP
jgi:hypothetical protein